VPIFIHPSGVQRGFDVLNAPYPLDRTVGRELDLMVTIIRMIFSGVLDEFPGLKLIFAHKGGGIASLKERIDPMGTPVPLPVLAILCPLKIIWQECTLTWPPPRRDEFCQVRTDVLKPAQLLFGTDYPQEFRIIRTGSKPISRISRILN